MREKDVHNNHRHEVDTLVGEKAQVTVVNSRNKRTVRVRIGQLHLTLDQLRIIRGTVEGHSSKKIVDDLGLPGQNAFRDAWRRLRIANGYNPEEKPGDTDEMEVWNRKLVTQAQELGILDPQFDKKLTDIIREDARRNRARENDLKVQSNNRRKERRRRQKDGADYRPGKSSKRPQRIFKKKASWDSLMQAMEEDLF